MSSSPRKQPGSSSSTRALDMLLHTPAYLLFLLLVALIFWALPWQNGRKALLLVSSYTFYILFDWRFAGLLLLISLATHRLGKAIHAGWRARQCSWLSVIINLGALGIFKYANFFMESVSAGLHALNLQVVSPGL